MAAENPILPAVVTYQFEIADDEWDDWKNTVPRSKSLDTRIRELIKADSEGRFLPADHDGTRPSQEYHDTVDEVVNDTTVVDRISSEWGDTEARLKQRRAAAEAALELARERGQLGRQTAVDELLPEYEVDGQNERTWWRQNVRPVLSEVATYSPGETAYVLEPES